MIEVLDSTLFEGGYINNWCFIKENIRSIISHLDSAHVDYLVVGAYQDNNYGDDSSFIDDVQKINSIHTTISKKIISLKVDWSSPLTNLLKSTNLDEYYVDLEFHNFNYGKAIDYAKTLSKSIPKLKCILHPIQCTHFPIDLFEKAICSFDFIDVDSIYIDDRLGLITPDQLKEYIVLIHSSKPQSKIAIRCNGDLRKIISVIEEYPEISFIIETTTCGIGIGGIVNNKTESLCEYLNDHGANYDIGELVQMVDWNLRPTCQKYGPISLLRGLEKYRRFDPEYLSKCSYDMQIWDYELIQFFDNIGEGMWYSKEMVDTTLRNIRTSYWKKKMCVIIPSFNRDKTIDFCLSATGTRLWEYGVDLIILDSSDNDKTKDLVQSYVDKGYTNIIYQYYETKDNCSLDQKIVDAYLKYSNDYEYIWLCRDGIAITFDYIHTQLEALINKKYDVIVVDSSFRDIWNTGNKHYDSPEDFFKDQCIRMVTLGTIILSSEFAIKLIESVPIDETNYSLWQVISIFQYYTNHPVNAASFCGNVFIYNPHGLLSSFWNTGGKAIWQWADRWCNTIDGLSEIYGPYKDDVMRIEMYDFHPFSLDSLLMIKSNGGLKINAVRKNKEYLKHVHSRPIFDYYVLSLFPIPKNKLKKIILNKECMRYKVLIKILRKIGIT